MNCFWSSDRFQVSKDSRSLATQITQAKKAQEKVKQELQSLQLTKMAKLFIESMKAEGTAYASLFELSQRMQTSLRPGISQEWQRHYDLQEDLRQSPSQSITEVRDKLQESTKQIAPWRLIGQGQVVFSTHRYRTLHIHSFLSTPAHHSGTFKQASACQPPTRKIMAPAASTVFISQLVRMLYCSTAFHITKNPRNYKHRQFHFVSTGMATKDCCMQFVAFFSCPHSKSWTPRAGVFPHVDPWFPDGSWKSGLGFQQNHPLEIGARFGPRVEGTEPKFGRSG